MASKKPKTLQFRRRRESKTDYKKRLHLLLSSKPRVVVRFTNQRIIGQIVTFDPTGDKVVVGLNSQALTKVGWKFACNNFPAAYLTGALLGKKAQEAGVGEAILDTGFRTPQRKGKVYAFLKGVIDSGLNVPHADDIFPQEERIQGAHIAAHNSNAAQITNTFETCKKSILG